MNQAMTPRQAIALIDKQIDANRRDLRKRRRFDEMTAGGWQSAWDANPDLYALDRDLFRQRGVAQLERDTADEAAFRADTRRAQRARRSVRPRPMKLCPTCGSHTLPAG